MRIDKCCLILRSQVFVIVLKLEKIEFLSSFTSITSSQNNLQPNSVMDKLAIGRTPWIIISKLTTFLLNLSNHNNNKYNLSNPKIEIPF